MKSFLVLAFCSILFSTQLLAVECDQMKFPLEVELKFNFPNQDGSPAYELQWHPLPPVWARALPGFGRFATTATHNGSKLDQLILKFEDLPTKSVALKSFENGKVATDGQLDKIIESFLKTKTRGQLHFTLKAQDLTVCTHQIEVFGISEESSDE